MAYVLKNWEHKLLKTNWYINWIGIEHYFTQHSTGTCTG